VTATIARPAGWLSRIRRPRHHVIAAGLGGHELRVTVHPGLVSITVDEEPTVELVGPHARNQAVRLLTELIQQWIPPAQIVAAHEPGAANQSEPPREPEVHRRKGVCAATLKQYASKWRLFCEWCQKEGHPPLPVKAGVVERYVRSRLAQGNKVHSIHGDLSSLAHYAREAGHPIGRLASRRELEAWADQCVQLAGRAGP
jgi:hypothetical protein